MAANTFAPSAFYLFNASVHSVRDPAASVSLKLPSTFYRLPKLSLHGLKATTFNPAPRLTTCQSKLFSVLQESTVLASQKEEENDEGKYLNEKEEENDEGKYLNEKEEEKGGNDSPKLESAPPVPSKRIYVGNLPYSCSSEELNEMFQQCGSVVSVQLLVDRESGKSRGFGFVTMSTIEEASKAIEKFDHFEMGARSISVSFPNLQPRREYPNRREKDFYKERYVESPHRVYVGNLAWTVTSEALGKLFESCTKVLGAKVIYDTQTGKSQGYGFVSFPSSQDVDVAIASLNGKDLEGRPVQIQMVKRRRATKTSSTNKLPNGDNSANSQQES